MKRKFTLFISLIILILIALLGVNIAEKVQSTDNNSETVIIDKDGNQMEPADKNEQNYGK